MKRLLLSLALACSTAFAAQPSDASIKELLTASDAPKIVDGMMGQVDQMMKGMLAQVTNGQKLTASQEAAFNRYQGKVVALMREEMTWAKLEPMYLRIYRDSLTQEEVDGMIAIYKTPAGQAMVKKMPVLMQKTMAEMPALMGPMMQKVQALAQEFAADMQAASTPAPAPETPAAAK